MLTTDIASIAGHPCSLLRLLRTVLLVALVACVNGCGGGGDVSAVPTSTIGVNISGLGVGGRLVLQNNGGDNLTASSNGNVNFNTPIASGSVYAVTIVSQPKGQTCTITNGSGTAGGVNVVTISVACITTPHFAYVASCGILGSLTAIQPGTISAYTVNDTTGKLTPVPNSSVASGIDPSFVSAITVDPTGRFAIVAYQGIVAPNSISTYAINATTGELASVGTVTVGFSTPTSVAVDPSGNFAYVAISGGNNILAYTINTTGVALSPIAGSPFAAGADPSSVTVDPGGKFAYSANIGSNNVSAYAINPSSGVLTPVAGSPFAAGTTPSSVTVDPSGKFAYVANQSSNDVSGFNVNTTTGALTPIVGSPFAAGFEATSVIVEPSGRFAYVVNRRSNDVSAFSVNTTTGALTPINGSPFAAGTLPNSITVDSTGKFAFVTNPGPGFIFDFTVGHPTFANGAVLTYSINASTGALAPIPDSTIATGPGTCQIAIK